MKTQASQTETDRDSLEGKCHCGEVKWTYEVPLESATACNCSLCRRYGSLWAYGFLGQGISIQGKTSAYQRDKKINGFHFCQHCGCICYYLCNHKNEEGLYRIAVNLRMITNPDLIQSLPIDHFEGLNSFEDLPRDGRCVRDLWF